MLEKKFCPFWNVGYCKFKYNCNTEHAQGDCTEELCNQQKYKKRHRKVCKYSLECKYFKQASCQFLHKKVFNLASENYNGELNIAKEEVYKLKVEIRLLEVENEKNVNQLVQTHMEEMAAVKNEVVKLKENIMAI